MGDLTVIIASFGDRRWLDLAQERAIPSLDGWDDTFVFHIHDDVASVGRVRNMAVRARNPTGWILFLDPDDELADGYIGSMQAVAQNPDDLYVPALQLIVNQRSYPARTLDDRDIISGINPCPIGTLIHRDTFDRVGGFWDERAWEDWSLFRRVVLTGGQLHFVPDAVYVAHTDSQGPNSTVAHPQQLRKEILDSHERWMQE